LKYYKLIQSKEVSNVLNIPNIENKEVKNGYGIVKQVKESKESKMLSFYEKPMGIVSEELKEAIKIYKEGAIGKPLALVNMKTNFSVIYYILNLEYVECKYERGIIIERKEIEKREIFKVKVGIMEYVLVSFNVAETILRRGNVDIELEEVKVNG
jgi:hypothetical protein